MAYQRFDVRRLQLKPLRERTHDMVLAEVAPLARPASPWPSAKLTAVAERMRQAKKRGTPIIVMMGAHVIKTGMSRFVIDLLERGFISHIGMNGATAIHDYELALIGATTESVAQYIGEGQFGLWQETGRINDIAAQAVTDDLGLGEALGREIAEGDYPYKDTSILSAGYRLGIPMTVHVALGQDIIHEHPNCDGRALGITSYRDFLVLAHTVERLEGGVLLNIGTAIMGPEVYLKVLAMARNVAHQEGKSITDFTTAVLDIQPIATSDFSRVPAKSDPEYYHRFFKTILVRTVQDGGESFYVQGEHQQTIPALWWELTGEDTP